METTIDRAYIYIYIYIYISPVLNFRVNQGGIFANYKIYNTLVRWDLRLTDDVRQSPGKYQLTRNAYAANFCHFENWTKRPTSWWRHPMESFPALLALCEGKPPGTGGFPSQRPVTQNFDIFFDLHLNKRLSKPSTRRWFETPSRSLWRHCNDFADMKFEQPLLHKNVTKISHIKIFSSANVSSNLQYKSHQIQKLKCFSSRFAVVFAWSIEARHWVENEDVVGAAPTGDAPTTSEWSTSLLPIELRLILEVWR